MAIDFYGATSLTGGGTGALDKIDGADLANGDGVVVITDNIAYFYHLNATSGAAESSPDIISPDTNAGDKRWILDTVHSGGYLGYIKITDTKAQNTQGGTFTSGAWQTRDLNTEDIDTNNDCTLNANQITLAAGTYECLISCPAYYVDNHQTRLYNTTGAAVVLLGTSEFNRHYLEALDQTRSFIVGRFTIAAGQALEIQHQCKTTNATYGFGNAGNFAAEVYTIAEFRRVN